MKSWYERSREYHSQHRRSIDGHTSIGASTGYGSSIRSASPEEFRSFRQSTVAPSASSYSDHYRQRTYNRPCSVAAIHQTSFPHNETPSPPRAIDSRKRVLPSDGSSMSSPRNTQGVRGSTAIEHTRTRASPLTSQEKRSARAASSPHSLTSADELASHPQPPPPHVRSDREWGQGIHAAAQLARSYALWETERASLVHSCDTLNASLQRERCMRSELEDQVRALRQENQYLKASLSRAIGSPTRTHASSPSSDYRADANGSRTSTPPRSSARQPAQVGAAAARYHAELVHVLQSYDGMLRDLKQLQTSPRASQAFSHYPITLHDIGTLLSSSSALSMTAQGDVLPIHKDTSSSSPCARLELEPANAPSQSSPNVSERAVAAIDHAYHTPDQTSRGSAQGGTSGNNSTVLLSPPPPADEASVSCAASAAPSSTAVVCPHSRPSLSPPPPFMRSATRSPPHDARPTKSSSPWRGPMHRFQPGPDHGGEARAPHVARPLYRTPPTALEREEVILATDKLTLALVSELSRLADEHEAHSASDMAALCTARGLDYVDVGFPPITASLGPGGCRVFVPETGREHTVQFQPADTLVPPNRQVSLISSAGIDPSAIGIGPLNDRGVAAGLAALAEASGALTSIFASTTAEDEESGLTRLWVCVGGVWTLVDVDSHVPVLQKDGDDAAASVAKAEPQLYGCTNRLTFDLWPAMCEKALAKVHGNYRATADLEASATLGLFTGGPVELWDWWRSRLDVAFDEIEAAINTTVRGSGIVLLTTLSTLSLKNLSRHHGSRGETHDGGAGESATLAGGGSPAQTMQAIGLSPATAYRVLAASEDATGQRMLLLRLWESATAEGRRVERATTTSTPRHRRLSPLRSEPPNTSDARSYEAGLAARGDDEPCVWLPLHNEIANLFEHCHVCFDCRRFHDVRVPVPFRGCDPCSPECVVRVDVRRPRDCTGDSPARLWIGLHQPLSQDPGSLGSVACSSLGYCGLKMALLVPELEDSPPGTQHRQSLSAALRAPPMYCVSESFGGHFQTRPSVWMYVEMKALTASTLTFYIIPQLDVSDSTLSHPVTSAAVNASSPNSAPVSPARTAVLALLAEEKELFSVQLLEAPSELPAALCHDGVDCLDMSTCVPYARTTKENGRFAAQVNGRWAHQFEW